MLMYISFFASLLISFLTFILLRRYTLKKKLTSKNKFIKFILSSKRRGGVFLAAIFILIFSSTYILLPSFILPKDFWSILAAVIILSIGGLWDDLKNIHWIKQLLFQGTAAIIILLAGDTIDHIKLPGGVFEFPAWLAVVSAFLWVIIIINSLNWFDGTDGLAGSISFITFLTLAVLSFLPFVNQEGTAVLCLIIAGIILGFLFFNFSPAFVELGTSGVWILGFLIAVISIYSGGKVATTALVLGLPILNFLFVSIERIAAGKYPFSGGDRLHLHERLEDSKWSNARIVVTMTFFSILWGIGALLTQTSGKIFLLISLSGVSLFFLLAVRSKLRLQRK